MFCLHSNKFNDACLMHVLQLVKLLESREANHIEFCKIKNVLDEVIQMHGNSDLHEILKLLIDPTWAATGLNLDFEKLVRIIVMFLSLFMVNQKHFLLLF